MSHPQHSDASETFFLDDARAAVSSAAPDQSAVCLARIGCALPGYRLPVTRPLSLDPELSHRCDLCGSELDAAHGHLLERRSQRLLCSCQVCAALLEQGAGRRYLRVPRRVVALPALRAGALDDDHRVEPGPNWPVSFLSPRTGASCLSVSRAGPRGVRQDTLPLNPWYRLRDANPALRPLRPDVETLLIRRTERGLAGWRVPVDRRCRLLGLLRLHGDSREHVEALLDDFVTRLDLEARAQAPDPAD